MPNRLLLLLGFLCFFNALSAQKYLEMIEAGTYTLSEIQKEAEAYFDIAGRERGSGYKPYKRWEYVAQMELDANGIKIPNQELARRARDYRRAERLRQTENNNSSANWKELGPTYWNATSGWNPGVGRVTSIGIDESNNQHLIVGSPTGGVWKTLDGGNTWTPLTDDFSTVDVYSLEISPFNKQLYLWGSTSGRIFRSTDGGDTWAATGNAGGNGKIIRILFHPVNPDVVYAVSETNGLYRSTNAGDTWTAVPGANAVPGQDVEFKPGDPNTMYFSGRNVYRSTNGGASFTQVSGFGSAANNHKMIGVSPANPNVVYVLESNGGRFGGFYKSINGGSSFTKLISGDDINYFGYSSTGDDDRGQAPRDMDVAVHPANIDEVHIAGIHTWKSVDGGQSFALTSFWMPGTAQSLGVGYNHADIDILKFSGDTLFVGSDGGMYISLDGAKSFIDRTSGLGIREFYKIGVSKTNPNLVSGGSQDNGTSVMRGANRAWVDWLGADGMETFIDWNNNNILYGTSQYGSMYRSTNQGNSRSSIPKPPDVGDGAWVTPFEQDPQVSTTIYVAFADVWKSTNSGTSWTKISNFAGSNMSQMKLAPSNNQRIYVSRGSSLFTTANGGGSWTTATAGWGSSTISYIAVHPQDPQRLLIVTSGGVYHSTNAGTSWTNISTGLPSGTKYCAAWENTGKNGIYVGGFGFVSYTNDDQNGQWVGFFDGLPTVRVYELEINYVSNTIFAGTYGRGLWESPLYQPLPPVAAFGAGKTQGCRGPLTVQFTDKSTNGPAAWEWTFEGGTPATSNLQNPVVTYAAGGNWAVRLKVSNNAGENTAEIPGYVRITDPQAPQPAGAERCGPGAVTLTATAPDAGQNTRWYAADTAALPLFTGDSFHTDIAQTTAFYAATAVPYQSVERVGPVSSNFGDGSIHSGNFYLIFDAQQPFRLKSATVYAQGAQNRTFQVRNSDGIVLLQKTVFVNDGESRVTLDLDIPQGNDLQIGCLSTANLYRNSSGAAYPYVIDGVVQIKGSTGGPGYYYYLYDLEVEYNGWCESDRVSVVASVDTAPDAPVVTASGPAALCPGDTLTLTAETGCTGCNILWSDGQTGPSITVSAEGAYTARATGHACGDSPASETLDVTQTPAPTTPDIAAAGDLILCPGETLTLTAENACPGCTITWSDGQTGSTIQISSAGAYSATAANTCGESPAQEALTVVETAAPEAPVIAANGPTELCPGETLTLTAENICAGCTVVWSDGQSGPAVSVETGGGYTARVSGHLCGDSPASNSITVTALPAPSIPKLVASGSTALCPGETLTLTAENVCAGCTVNWSNGQTGPTLTIDAAGVYLAFSSGDVCGDSQVSEPVLVTVVDAPVAPSLSASGPTALCPGASITLTAGNVCSGCTVIWSDGQSGPAITVSGPGVYTAKVNSPVCGDSPDSDAIQITTASLPETPEVIASGPTALCPGATLTLTAGDVCPGCTVVWSDGQSGESISVSEAGIYTAIAQNQCGDSPASEGIAVTVFELPAAPALSASGPTALCPGETLTLTAENVCAGCAVNWSDGQSGTSITVSTPGVYTAVVKNQCGEGPASEGIAVSAVELPAAPFVAASGPTALCAGETLTLAAENVCAGCTVTWSDGQSGASITVSEAGVYTAVVKNQCGEGTASEGITVTVDPEFIPEVTVSDVCHLAAPAGSDYQWHFEGLAIPGATSQTWMALDSGFYTVTMNNLAGCPGNSAPVFVAACVSSTHNPAGAPAVRVFPNPAQSFVTLELTAPSLITGARLELYAADGRLIGTLFRGDFHAGKHTARVDLPELPQGLYRYRLVTAEGNVSGSLGVVR